MRLSCGIQTTVNIDSATPPGYRQVTDTHLLTLALRHGGCLATFDHRGVTELVDPDRAAVELIP